MKELFKKDSKSKIRSWKIWTVGGELIQESGLVDGKKVKHSKLCTTKNFGKSNETSPTEQALLEMESEIKSKLTEGYFETEDEARNEVVILPMLAKSYEDEKHKIDWSKDVWVQPKLDGMRCLAIIKNGNVTLKSRDGKIIENMDHIIQDLSKIKEDIVLDGELYAHGLSFQENMKLVKKYRPGKTEDIKYIVYDKISNDDYSSRYGEVVDYRILNGLISKHWRPIEGSIIKSEQELLEYHKKFISEGYEGSMVKHGNEPYKMNGRSSSLLKYKDFSDMDLEIFQITPNDANPKHGTPHFNLKGKAFKSGVKMSHEDREDLLTNKDKYIGKIANIRYFELTDDGIPRFPVMIGIHEDR